MTTHLRPLTLLLALASLAGGVAAQSIYTCTDAKGRKLTSDRPILECNDRDQKELTPTGTVKRIVKPVMTAEEAAKQDEKDKADAEERARQAEERRRDKALLLRYPSKAVHDQERTAALAQVDEVIKAANKRIGELAVQRKTIDADMEFYAKDPSKAPPSLKRQVDENNKSVAAQKRFILDQNDEKKRVNLRFDEELVKLKPLWAGRALATPTVVNPSASEPAR